MVTAKDPALSIVDPSDPLPVHEQLKNQIKLAYALGLLSPGQGLPSIRALAAEAGVGEALVRRAYRELTTAGLLVTKGRRSVALSSTMMLSPRAETLIRVSYEEVERLLRWTLENGLNPISFARLVSRRALVEQLGTPSCAMVDACKDAAANAARRVAKAWDIKVAALSLADFAELTAEERQRLTTILVDSHFLEDLLQMCDDLRDRVFAVKSQLAQSFIQRVRRLPRRSSILIVVSGEYFQRAGQSIVLRCREAIGTDYQFDVESFRDTLDIAALLREQRYHLIVLQLPVWNQVLPRVRRLRRVMSSFTELGAHAIEEVRIAAGVVI